jgi:soluble lytic murein transglycosylase-like protein
MIRRSIVLGVALLATVAFPARADIYKFVDAEGRTHFSDVRLDPRFKLFMKTAPVVPAASTTTASAQPTTMSAVQRAALVRPYPLKARYQYAEMVTKVAQEQKLDSALLHAVISVESAYNPAAKSPKGATGLMQLMPATAKRYGVTQISDPLDNIRGGAKYLKDLIAMFDNKLHLAIAAYNAGEGSVIRSGNKVPNFPETRAYVPRVLQYYETYKAAKS